MASSLVANARTGSLRARMRRPALVNKCTLNGAGSGSSVGLFGVRAFTLSQQKRRAESRCSVRPALSELFVCGAASDPDALRYRPQPILSGAAAVSLSDGPNQGRHLGVASPPSPGVPLSFRL